jgi:FMN phosphatase YigB (HAD superfamily)
MNIRVIALDIYGTVLATDDPDNELPPRRGIEEFFDERERRKIKVVSTSDADITTLKINLRESKVDVTRFDRFYCLNQLPCKDYSAIVRDYNITPKQLLVVGDSDKDINGAKACGAKQVRVPEYYNTRDNFDINKEIFC